jgi:hypothetical protein
VALCTQNARSNNRSIYHLYIKFTTIHTRKKNDETHTRDVEQVKISRETTRFSPGKVDGRAWVRRMEGPGLRVVGVGERGHSEA